MFAIVEIAGLQYKVEQDQKLFVNRLKGDKGGKVSFDKVLLTVNGSTTIGAPAVSGITVDAEILAHVKADKVIIGGGMAYTFLKAQGKEVGKSLLELDKVDLAKRLLAEAGDKLVLPIDVVVADDFSNDANIQTVSVDNIPADWEGLDCGPESIKLFNASIVYIISG